MAEIKIKSIEILKDTINRARSIPKTKKTELLNSIDIIELETKNLMLQKGNINTNGNALVNSSVGGDNTQLIIGGKYGGKYSGEDIIKVLKKILIDIFKDKDKPEKTTEIDIDFNAFKKELYGKISSLRGHITGQCTSLYESLSDLIKTENNEIKKEISDIKSALAGMPKEIETIISEYLEVVVRFFAHYASKLDEINNKIKGLESSIDSLYRDVNEIRKEFNDNLNVLIDFLANIEKRLERIEQGVDDANRTLIDVLDRLNHAATTDDIDALLLYIEQFHDIINQTVNIQTDLLRNIQTTLGNIIVATNNIYSQGRGNRQILINLVRRINNIETTLHNVATRDDITALRNDMNANFDIIRQLIQTVLTVLERDGGGGEDPGGGEETIPAGARFELVWVIARNQATAQHLEQINDLPGYPNHSNDYIILNYFLNPHQLHVQLNQESLSQLIHTHIPNLATEMSNRGFQLNEVYLRLGARIIGTQRPWRWDI